MRNTKYKIRDTKISAIVLTKNSEDTLGKCLKSINWADEILIIDSGSKDNTFNIAKKYEAAIVSNINGSFSDKRNMGAKSASGKWLLYVDADELVTPSLREEIGLIINNKKLMINGYAIPRRNILLGHKMKYGGWWPDYVLRLIKKKALKGWKGELHEQPEIDGLPAQSDKVGKLENPLIHNTHRSLTAMLTKTNEWSEIEAKLMYNAGHPKMNVIRFASAMGREFWYRAVRNMGFLDGPVGIIEIIYQIFSRFVSYAKLWEMQIKDND